MMSYDVITAHNDVPTRHCILCSISPHMHLCTADTQKPSYKPVELYSNSLK